MIRSRRLLVLILTVALAGMLGARTVCAQFTADEWVPQTTLWGTTGLVNTPTADVLPSDALRFGVMYDDRKWTHDQRDKSDAYHTYLTVGFVPRVEISLRFTYHPDDFLDEQVTDPGTVDRGANGRLLVLTEGRTRPALAVGIDDVRGTRRFHSLYAVASKWVTSEEALLKLRLSGGYGSAALDTVHERVLNGWFGGGELVYGNFVSAVLDFDTEKWNTSIRLVAFQRLAAQVVLLNLETLSGGVSWTQRF
jgi:hypothetical protein